LKTGQRRRIEEQEAASDTGDDGEVEVAVMSMMAKPANKAAVTK
jgi:hypothetical protein